MLPSTDALSGLLGTLYDAAGEPVLWDRFLEQLAHTVRAGSAALVMLDLHRRTHAFSRSWQIDPAALALYQEYYGSIDVWAKQGAARPAGQVFASQSLCSVQELRRTEVYNDYMVPFDFEHGMFSVIEGGGPRVAALSLYRDSTAPEFKESELEVLRFLTPHMQRASRLHFQLSGLRTRGAELGAALDMVPQGVIFLSESGEIVRMNRAADAITARNDGLIATRKGLSAERPSESVQLGRLIQEAITTASGKGLGPAGELSVSRKKGPSLQVLITPARSAHVDVEKAVYAIVFVSDPAQKVRPTHDTLRTLFGLTPAECRVALLLGDGKSPREIAQLLAVSSNTVKSQVSAIYAKTGTSRHAELVRLMASLQGSPCL